MRKRRLILAGQAALLLAGVALLSCGPCGRPDGGAPTTAGTAEEGPAGPLYVTTSQPSYLRYDIVEVRVRADADVVGELTPDNTRGVIKRDGEVVTTVGGIQDLTFRAGKDGGLVARWPIPWNPPLGKYSAEVGAETASGKFDAAAEFEIAGRKPAALDKPFCVVTLESDGRWERKYLASPGENHDYTALVDWAEFMGADAFFTLVGITKAMYAPTMENPWYQHNLDFSPKLADECHARGIKFGGWIGSFLPYGKTQVPLPYKYSRNLVEGEFWYTLHISLNDERRFAQVIELARTLQNDPHYDYVGLDYIRTGFGGYELVDEFVRDLAIDVPADWEQKSLEGQMWWLVAKLRSRDQRMIELWQWWRARKVALTVKRIKDEAGITKPLFAYTLGWEMGHQHGQDILMMNDAGVDCCMVMLYEATKDEYDYLIKRWPEYLEEGQVNAVPGISVDRYLLLNKWNPNVNQPYEMFDRYLAAVEGFYGKGELEGLFWHDFERGLYSRRGEEFTCMDYAVAGAAAFSRLREKRKASPLELRITRVTGGPRVKITLKNVGDKALRDVEVFIPQTHGINPGRGARTTVASIAPGETAELTVAAGSWDISRRHIVAVCAVWGDRPRDRAFDVAIATLYRLPKPKPAEEKAGEGEPAAENTPSAPPPVKDSF
ncbi:MAG: hypothetical protein PVH29_02635 [Candidatus Zixiibacteriota bacterium]|jgi:hypothetical protein